MKNVRLDPLKTRQCPQQTASFVMKLAEYKIGCELLQNQIFSTNGCCGLGWKSTEHLLSMYLGQWLKIPKWDSNAYKYWTIVADICVLFSQQTKGINNTQLLCRSGVLQMQKLRTHLVGAEDYQRFPLFKPGV